MKERKQPSFMAWLPPKVRYDKELPPNAKLLFAEIAALTDKYGICWANNGYFTDLYGLKERTVRDLLSKLAAKGFISIEIVRNSETNEFEERRIMLGATFRKWANDPDTPPADFCRTPGENSPDPSGENLPEERYNNINDNPPIVPPEGDKPAKRKRARREPEPWQPERFEAFWKIYPKVEGNRNQTKQAAKRAWDKLRADDALLASMGKYLMWQMASEQWQREFGIPYASTWLNRIAKDGVPDFGELPQQEQGDETKGDYRL